MEDAADFGEDHPQFKIILHRHDPERGRNPEHGRGDGGLSPPDNPGQGPSKPVAARVSMDEDPLEDYTGLTFSHDLHLSRQGLATFDGIFQLWCNDCHRHKAGERAMAPLRYETACQRCHPLTFEPSDDTRQVPHGQISQVLYMLEEYYGNRALNGGYPDALAPDVVRRPRQPDEALSAEEQHTVRQWAKEKALDAGRDLFEFNGCVQCHTVTAHTDGKGSAPRWEIAPVTINRATPDFNPEGETPSGWFARARFSHGAHNTMSCLFCHPAPESDKSADVLIPPITICRQCHGGARAATGLQSTCVDCHRFHVAENFTMRNMKRLLEPLDSADSADQE